MPIYEEKLISPLAIRFTQENVRPVFQDGTDLEATIKKIKPKPGSGDYDVILEAPFPCVEIIRWHQKGANGLEPDADHWFSLDNRRTLCLQRAAAALWPQRVGAVVEVLYHASREAVKRKDDSSTSGRSVGIGHSPKMLVGRWDWREVLETDSAMARSALDVVCADDRKSGVVELQDAPAAPSLLSLALGEAMAPELTGLALGDAMAPELTGLAAKANASRGSTEANASQGSTEAGSRCSTEAGSGAEADASREAAAGPPQRRRPRALGSGGPQRRAPPRPSDVQGGPARAVPHAEAQHAEASCTAPLPRGTRRPKFARDAAAA